MTPVGLGLPAQRQAKNRHPNIIGPRILASTTNFKSIPMAQPAVAGIPIYIVGDEIHGFLGNDMGGGHGNSLKIGGRSKDSGIDDVWVHVFGLSLCW